MLHMIRVSDLTAYLKCPRMCYFMNRGQELIKEPTVEYIQRLLLKEMALIYSSALNEGNTLSALDQELDRLSNEIRIIYRQELAKARDDILKEAVFGVRGL